MLAIQISDQWKIAIQPNLETDHRFRYCSTPISPLDVIRRNYQSMDNFDFKRTSRKCSVSGKEFEAGEEYISVLIQSDAELIRQDIAMEQWSEPPEQCVGWWKSRVPDLEQGIVYWAPKDVLLSYFQHLVETQRDEDTTYVMAILLLQKKHLRLLDTEKEDGVEMMRLLNSSSKETFSIKAVDVDATRVKAIENELAEKLFTDVAPSAEPEL